MMKLSNISELLSETISDFVYEKQNILNCLEEISSDKSKKLIKLINDYDDLGNNILEELEEIRKDED